MSVDRTSHAHLMDLASRWSYADGMEVNEIIDVGGTDFEVLHAETGTPTGLDAFTLRNTETQEVTIAFQGSTDELDWSTNAQLLGGRTPAQFEAAAAYVARMRQKHPGLTSVCGNSLGGGLAAYVALLNPDLTAVTVNPAPVPAAYAAADAPNVHNYISDADVLFRALLAARLGNQVVGNLTVFSGTSRNAAFVLDNHIGSDRGDPDETAYNASMAVPFSLFHADVVLGSGGFGDRVRIDPAAVEQMAAGLDRQRDALRAVVRCELDGLQEAMHAHARDVPVREAAARREFLDTVVEGYAEARRLIDRVAEDVRDRVRSPLVSLPPVPAPLRPAWAPVGAALDAALIATGQSIDPLLGFAVRGAAAGVWDAACAPLYRESEVIAAGLAAHCGALRADLVLIDDKWSTVCAQSRTVAFELELLDATIAAGIVAGRLERSGGAPVCVAWPSGRVEPLQGDLSRRFAQLVVETRQSVAGEVVLQLARGLVQVLGPVEQGCAALETALAALEAALTAATRTVRAAIWTLQRSPAGVVAESAGLGDDVRRFSQALEDVRTEVVARSGDLRDLLRSVRRVVGALPDAVEGLRPFLHDSMFADTAIEEAYDALLKCRNVTDRSRTAFREIAFQLADHEARSVDELAENAGDLGADLSTTVGSLAAMLA
jgi:pimeloyl-ACP methyl ester carboxylesterase